MPTLHALTAAADALVLAADALTAAWATASAAVELTAIALALHWVNKLIRYFYLAGHWAGTLWHRQLKGPTLAAIALLITCVVLAWEHRQQIYAVLRDGVLYAVDICQSMARALFTAADTLQTLHSAHTGRISYRKVEHETVEPFQLVYAVAADIAPGLTLQQLLTLSPEPILAPRPIRRIPSNCI